MHTNPIHKLCFKFELRKLFSLEKSESPTIAISGIWRSTDKIPATHTHTHKNPRDGSLGTTILFFFHYVELHLTGLQPLASCDYLNFNFN